MKGSIVLLILVLFSSNGLIGQINFRNELESSDPIPENSDLSKEKQIIIHQDFLKDAIKKGDTKNKLFGNLYIFMDYIKMEDYVEAAKYLFEAENIAKLSENVGWEGWVSSRSGLLFLRIDQHENALESQKRALELCSLAGDSLCVGESLEQIGALNSVLGNHEEAEKYFNKATPIIEKFGSKKNIGTLLNNFGNFFLLKGEHSKAIPILQKGIDLNLEIENFKSAAKSMNNLAVSYRRLGQYDKAIDNYKQALKINKEHGFLQNMIRNYLGLHIVYEDKKDFEKSMNFLIKRNQLKDSLIGQETQLKIAELEAKYNNINKEYELERTKSKLLSARQNLERMITIFLFTLLIIGFLLWYFRAKSLSIKTKKDSAEKEVKNITKILIEKNALILTLKQELSTVSKEINDHEKVDDLQNIIQATILTNEEWDSYKMNFEKAYPGFLYKLRNSFEALTDAEERLFVLIKLQLKTREIAAVLGISSDSVKKTRQRLRKRIQLEKDDSLEEFIKNF